MRLEYSHSAHNFAEKQHILVMDMFGHLTIKYKLNSNKKFNLINIENVERS